MKKIGCYRGLSERASSEAEAPLGGRARAARAIAGLFIIAGVGLLYLWPVALLPDLGVPGFVAWSLAILSLWLGVSHLVAAATAYRGCPEAGAILSLVLRRHVITTCRPWERLDRRMEGSVPH
jgi:multisubunit Na+/H+ antiporter MnhB subunit